MQNPIEPKIHRVAGRLESCPSHGGFEIHARLWHSIACDEQGKIPAREQAARVNPRRARIGIAVRGEMLEKPLPHQPQRHRERERIVQLHIERPRGGGDEFEWSLDLLRERIPVFVITTKKLF